MNTSAYRLRRATTDDLDSLLLLWERSDLPASELEKRFTEFQVIEDAEGRLVGAIGIRIIGKQAIVHSETLPDFSRADELRPLIWMRLETVAQNHGIVRLWTEESAPFWKQVEFVPVDEKTLKKLPEGEEPDRHWLTLQLRDEAALPLSVEKEFAAFKEAERARTDQIFAQARTAKMLANALAVLLFVLVIAGVVYAMKQNRELKQPWHQR